jgi:hypothetical protein
LASGYGQPTPVAAVVVAAPEAVVDEQAGLVVGVVDKALGFV